LTRRSCGSSAARAKSARTRAATTGHSARATASRTEPWARSASSAATAPTARTFRRKNHLQELVGVFEEILELIALRAQSLGRELRGHLDPGYRRIFGNIANLVDLNAGFTGERRFQLLSKRGRFCISAGKAPHEPGKLRLREVGREVDAGNSRARQQLRETFFAGRGAKRHTIQQDLVSRSSKQESAAGALIERTSELFPRSFELRRRSHMAKFIEPCELQ
jgi:hypothetical protein